MVFNYMDGRDCLPLFFPVVSVLASGQNARLETGAAGSGDFAFLRLGPDAELGAAGDIFGFLRLRASRPDTNSDLAWLGHPDGPSRRGPKAPDGE